MSKMYEETVTWNPFKGCCFDCVYCDDSFKRQAKRQKHNCKACYTYEPHFHPERLKRYLPKNKLIFACANGDIAFAKQEWLNQIIDEMRNRTSHTFLLQTKKPSCLSSYSIPDNVIVGTTIETNRDTGNISKAPCTTVRYVSLKNLDCRKFVTFEPIMDFDEMVLVDWVKSLKPEMIWVGYNNYTRRVKLDEPSLEKTNHLIEKLKNTTDVRLKTIRDSENRVKND